MYIGQLKAIRNVLHRRSTLLALPTGAGKSLCYQLPSYILSKVGCPGITIVISPMISLIQDQLKCLPKSLIGVCLSSQESVGALIALIYNNY
jgi:ATP-dependent DNA helicase Q4